MSEACAHEGALWIGGRWHCDACQTTFAGGHDFDRRHIQEKARAILHEMHDAGDLYVSNNTDGDYRVADMVARLRADDLYTTAAVRAVAQGDEATLSRLIQDARTARQRARHYWTTDWSQEVC